MIPKVCLAPLGVLDQAILGWVMQLLAKQMQYRSWMHQGLRDLDMSSAFNRERQQYDSKCLLVEIVERIPDDGSKIVGITGVDLYVPILTFVFGQAQLGGRAAIVSIHRLRQEYYHLPRNDDLLKERVQKEVLHELGHTFGLTHCPDTMCVMHFSNSVREIDHKVLGYCSACSGDMCFD